MIVYVSEYDNRLVVLFDELKRKAILAVYPSFPDTFGSLNLLDMQRGVIRVFSHGETA